jgi:hypothetical protein
MKLSIPKNLIILIFLLIISSISLTASEQNYKWEKFGVTWLVSESKAQPRFAPAASWNYTELSNYNSIISILHFSKFNLIQINTEIFDRTESPSEFMISFNVKTESQSWFYHMYAFKLTGGYWGMNKASFIYSDRLDKSKPFNTKNNIFVKELASADCKVKYDKMYNYRVSFEGENVVLYINDEKILSAPFPEKSHDGRIAISSRNVKIAVDKVTVKKGNETIFEDDFNEDSIYVRVLKVKKVPAGDGQNKKP